MSEENQKQPSQQECSSDGKGRTTERTCSWRSRTPLMPRRHAWFRALESVSFRFRLRVRRTIWNPFGRQSESGWETSEEAHEGHLLVEALAQAQTALEPIWQDPEPEASDATITTIRLGDKSWDGVVRREHLRKGYDEVVRILEEALKAASAPHAEALKWPPGLRDIFAHVSPKRRLRL